MTSALDEILQKLQAMPDKDRAELEVKVKQAISKNNKKWLPNPGPQTDAYFSRADITYYGGAGGGGKTDWGLGLALTMHHRTMIVRRQFTDLTGITDRAVEINGTRKGFTASPRPRLCTDDGRIIDFGAAKNVGDEQSRQGIPIDLLYVDEAAQFAESQIRFWMGWIRTTKEGQRTRVCFGSNPPLSEEGYWLMAMFAPWIDPAHSNPAKPGELRWRVRGLDDELIEVDGPGLYDIGEKEPVNALSYTFIPAKREDNPHLNAEYKAAQDNLPPHLRAAIRDGNFMAARRDHELQLIPSEWIMLAQENWRATPPDGIPQCAIGVDIAQGGSDKTVLAIRHDGWFAPLIERKGVETKTGLDVAGLVMSHRRDSSTVVLDMGGGYGGATYESLYPNLDPGNLRQYKGSEKTIKRTKNGKMPYFNTRAGAYYSLYEALDPDQPGGQRITLPRDPEMFSELCSIRLDLSEDNIIKLEPKKKLIERTGKSPNKADAIAIAWWCGNKIENSYDQWRTNRTLQTKAITNTRRHRNGGRR